MTRSRKEFSRSVRVAIIKRATDTKGLIRCEQCRGVAKPFEIDHVNPDGLTGEPILENGMLLCLPCHDAKTSTDVKAIAKAKRREAAHLGAALPATRKIRSAPFPASAKRKSNPTPAPVRTHAFGIPVERIGR